MRFWFEHSSEISLREQIVTQVTLGILCGELAPGERLPSIRELARRFGLHANTVSAGYQQLESDGWVVSRKGSGVYVRESPPAAGNQTGALSQACASPEVGLHHIDRLIANLLQSARRLQIPSSHVIARVQALAAAAPIERLLLIEPDPELRRIILAELAECTTLSLLSCDFGESAAHPLANSLVLTLPSKLQRVRAELAATPARIVPLAVRSVPASLAEHLPPPASRAGILVGIASRWPEFLRFARTMLVAAGFAPEALIVRDAREPQWRDGLAQAAAVICDLATARDLPGARTIISRILAETTAADLARALQSSATAPQTPNSIFKQA